MDIEVYRNGYQENEPVRPDDTGAVRGEVGVTKQTAGFDPLYGDGLDKADDIGSGEVMGGIGSKAEGGKNWTWDWTWPESRSLQEGR